MNLPVIETPVFPRWVWMEEITFSHIPIATLITAFMLLAPAFEYLGVRRRDLRWERLSKSMIWFSLILFSPGAALGTGIPMFIIGTYPEFWSRWSNLFYWPLIVQFGFFLGEVFFLFFFYYLTWDRWAHRKGLHITMGVCAAFFGYMVQVVWDSLGSYMMTPGMVPLPQVDQPVAWSWRAMLNPSFLALLTHRTFGNFSYVLLLTGGVFALRYRGQKRKDPTSENTAYFHWASGTCFLLGFLFFFPMPIIGWHYARVVQREAPAAFLALMGGHVSHYFILKMSLILSFLAIGGTFVVQRYGSKVLVGAITVGLLLVLAVVQIHPPLAWLGGNPLAWRLVATAVLLGLIGWLWLRRGAGDTQRKGWQWAMFIAGMAAFFTFLLGGFVRERSRNPDTVYGQIVKPEVKEEEADRYLVYTKWLRPQGLLVPDLERRAPADWGAQVQQARQQGLDLTEQEAERIIRYLEEHHR